MNAPADLNALAKVLAAIGTLQVTALRDVGTAEIAPTKPRLSERETDALIVAHLGGYYEQPRKRSAQELAQKMAISHTAFLGHLRRAEAKILSAHLEAMAREEPGRVEAAAKRSEARPKVGSVQRRTS